MKSKPTKDQYDTLEKAFGFFNRELFSNELPRVLLTFSRRAFSSGFFASNTWKGLSEAPTHEISLNPNTLKSPLIEVYSTLVHEQVHLWQHEFGKPSTNNYHNREWSEKMESIGLIPSKTGRPGGEKTGRPMSHYISSGGLYEIAFNKMPTELHLPLENVRPDGKVKNKIRHYCIECEYVAWTNIPCSLVCGTCGSKLIATTKT